MVFKAVLNTNVLYQVSCSELDSHLTILLRCGCHRNARVFVSFDEAKEDAAPGAAVLVKAICRSHGLSLTSCL